MLSYVDYVSETSQSIAECELTYIKEQAYQVTVAQWVGRPLGVGSGRGCAPPQRIFFLNLQVNMQGFNHFVAKKPDLWSAASPVRSSLVR